MENNPATAAKIQYDAIAPMVRSVRSRKLYEDQMSRVNPAADSANVSVMISSRNPPVHPSLRDAPSPCRRTEVGAHSPTSQGRKTGIEFLEATIKYSTLTIRCLFGI